jgi:glycerophosphoryl diester phosphodiesterase
MKRPLVIAHRGASAVAHENSLAALESAIAGGADLVEVDVRLSADGVPVAAHDPDLTRLAGTNVQVSVLTASELALHGIETLETVARKAAGRVPLLLDPKADGSAFWHAVLQALSAGSMRDDASVVFGARSVAAVMLVRAARPSARILGFTAEPAAAASFIEAGANLLRLWETDVSREAMAAAKAMQSPIWVTMGRAGDGSAGDATAASLISISQFGPAGILVNDPAMACAVLGRSGTQT